MRFLDYIFYCAYSHFRNLKDGAELASSIIYLYCICYTILYPIVTSLELLCSGHCNLKTWQIILIESPLIIFLIYRYVNHKKTILKKFTHFNHSKKFLFIFLWSFWMVLIIISLNLSIYLQKQILKRGLEGTWNISEFISNFAGE